MFYEEKTNILEKKKKTERYWPKLSEKKDWFM
jgi:hypothetical protein